MKWLCWHKWSAWSEPEQNTAFTSWQERVCLKCNKIQQRECYYSGGTG